MSASGQPLGGVDGFALIADLEVEAGALLPAAVADQGHGLSLFHVLAHLAQQPDSPIRAALLVAPADPAKFGLSEQLPATPLPRPLILIYSLSDPWMRAASARRWALAWGAQAINLGDAGHINAEAGFGPLPLAQRWADAAVARWARELRPRRASFAEWQFAT